MINKNITSKEDTISIASGYEIEDIQGNRAKVCYIDYVSRIVVIVQDGKGHNLFFHEICRDWFRVLEENKMKKEAIVYTEGGERLETTITEITLVEGDTIIGYLSCEHKVVYIDYIRKMVVISSGDGSVDVLDFDDIVGGYHRVVEDIEFGNIYSVRATISLEVGDVIIDRARNKYNVDAIEYDNVSVFCSKGTENYIFPFVAFAEGNYMKVVK